MGAHHTHLTEAVLLAGRSYMIYEDGHFEPATHTRTHTHVLLTGAPALQQALETLMVTYMERMQTEAF